ncbi:MAG TPA: histidine kinase [Actinophytocola sp.]|uniref:sensor histidine kinase n=1 Tax=Actinophytocola sp. TaxID=1872138 RepID=UPI002DB67B8B|nr:histidine kinase [Actinophytocola sp.]HEU5470930.1 histidine kinase [Actinophytocola sp.]
MADRHLPAADPAPARGEHEMTWWRRSLARLGGHTPTGRDTVVAVTLAVLGLGRIPLALLLNDGRLPSSGAVVALATLVSTVDFATIAVRRRAPRAALAVAVLAVLAATALPAAYPLTGIGTLVCAYTVATMLPRRPAISTLAAAAAGHAAGGIVSVALGGRVDLVATFWATDGGPVNLVLASVGTVAIPGLIGLYVRTNRAYAAELAARVTRLEAERELRESAAAAEERARIARELHDVAAHDLSAIVVQAGAADRLLDRDPDQAREALRSIRAQGRHTLAAMRELVGVLRTRPEDEVPAPQPSLSMVDDLVATARDTGMAVTVHATGTPAALSPATDVAAYRLVQEALSNARQHAPGARVDVRVDYRAADLTLTVHNGPAGRRPPVAADGGYGLLGMRERIRYCGGDLCVGPTGSGGWRVVARLPLAHREPA